MVFYCSALKRVSLTDITTFCFRSLFVDCGLWHATASLIFRRFSLFNIHLIFSIPKPPTLWVRSYLWNMAEPTTPKCQICFRQFRDKTELRNHLLIHHLKKKNFECATRQKMCSTKKYLSEHIRTKHTPQKTFTCPTCSSRFNLPNRLNAHIRRVHSEPIFTCNNCNRKYKHKKKI